MSYKRLDAIETLKVTFTNEELLAKGKELAAKGREIAEVQDRMNSIRKQLQAEVAELEQRQNILRSHVHDGYSYQPVKCVVILDYIAGTKALIRLDTGEEVWNRELEPHERQTALDLSSPGGAAPQTM